MTGNSSEEVATLRRIAEDFDADFSIIEGCFRAMQRSMAVSLADFERALGQLASKIGTQREPGILRAAAQWRVFEQLARRDAIIAGLIDERVAAVQHPRRPRLEHCEHMQAYRDRSEHRSRSARDHYLERLGMFDARDLDE